jgi:probable phosphoglycerate mutase
MTADAAAADPHDEMTWVILVRHAETVWNREGRMQGDKDSPLTPRGLAQAQALAGAFEVDPPLHVYSSDQGRALATAEAVAERCGLVVKADRRLRERHYGDLQGLTWHELRGRHPDLHARFQSRDPDFAPPGGESIRAFQARVMPALEAIASAHHGERILILTHGGVVGLVYRQVLSMPLDAPRDYRLENASINRFRWAQGRWQLQVWGDTGHLEALQGRDDLI